MIDDSHLQPDDIGKIGESAVQMFFQKWRWHPRKDADDQGIDFSVEIPRASDGLRRRFLVQVKTSNPVTVLKDGDWSVPVEQGALRKYRTTREPVLLIAYDLPTDQMRFIHLQRWIEESKRLLDGPRDAALHIRLVAANSIPYDGSAEFQRSVLEAWDYQDARHFSAPRAIQHMERELSQLDGRLNVDVCATKYGYEIAVRASSEPVDASVTVTPSSLADAEGFSNAVRFGSAAKLNVDDMRLHGSPLFDRMPRGPAIVELGSHPHPVTLRLGEIREKKPRNTLRKLIELTGELTKGSHGVEIKSTDSRVPFRIAYRSDSVTKQAKIDLSIRPEQLTGVPLRAIGAAKLHELLRLGADGCMGMQVLLGDQRSPGVIPLRQPQGESSAFLMLALQAARLAGLESAARRSRSELRWGSVDEITVEDEESWLTAWRLFHEGSAAIPSPTLTVNAVQPDVLFASPDRTGVFILTGTEYPVTGWGMEVCRLPVVIEFHGYKAVRTSEDTARIEPSPDSRAVMRLQKKSTPL